MTAGVSGRRRIRWFALAALAALALAADATSGSAQEAAGRRIIFDRFGYRLARIGETVTAKVGILDASLLPEPNPALAWRVDNPAIASVNARGVVQARGVGYTRLWVVSGRDSSFVMVVVTGNTIQFTPSPLRFDAAGGRLALRIRLLDPAGKLLEDLARTRGACRSLDESVATIGLDGQVASRRTGVTHVQCSNRGVTDSVRIEVGQRAVKLEIANGLKPMTVGDTIRIYARAENSSGEAITGNLPTWASLHPAVARIDSSTGFTRAVGPGGATIIARLGAISDTARVMVQAAPIAVALRLDPILPFVDDTVRVTATMRNSAGLVVANPDPYAPLALRSSRPDIVAVIGDQRVVALKAGSAWVVATSGTLADSTQVSPRGRNAGAVQSGTALDSATQRSRQTLDTARAANPQAPPLRIGGKVVELTATASRTTHSSTLAQGLNEGRSGLLVGAAASVAPTGTLVVAGDFRTGTLTGNDPSGGDLKLTEVVGQLTYWPTLWFGLRGGYTRRSEGTDLVLHHWQFANATAVTRFSFAGGALTAVSAVSLLPWGGFSGHVDNAGQKVAPNKTSFAAEVGLEYQAALLSAAIAYYGENFTFPSVNGTSRSDRFSSLRLRIGVHGWPLGGSP